MKERVDNMYGHKLCDVDDEAKTVIIKREHHYTVIRLYDDKPHSVEHIPEAEYEAAG